MIAPRPPCAVWRGKPRIPAMAKTKPDHKPMRRKSKRVTALPHVDVTAPKRQSAADNPTTTIREKVRK